MRSILSSGEREVAWRLADGQSVEDIAAARDQSVETVEKHVDRIREKTERAVATLVESPFAEAVLADLDPEARETVAALARRADS
ncbi:LuxR C-terminal-related transcriptional regulator [Halomarina litorea]|uniref:LuxR C-terminal-related transcriptional regulator n=1 Tax=Halomarina litorea TaxID=2961595 RepID=UPI0020C25883|nr:LuxR C-terminal-related transcriptional regulator [Halomarina sp. BCD28]